MNDKEIVCCYDNTEDKCPRKKNCLGIVGTILLVSFGVVIGLIIGAAISEAVLAALPAVIVLAVVLGLLFILNLILIICNKKKYRR
ncbi:MAG: hypothetical protein IJH39_01420 [Clostridia bacterium]|nr:hypothetical protein [Clostridia bacterium]